ncbi:hypothetical protein J7L87_00790 [bacterium]|nr:hypothetical protein [bacterium]
MKKWCFVCFFFLFSIHLAGKSFSIPEVTLPLIKKVPVIDGNIDEKEWEDAARIIGFMKSPTDIEERIGIFWIGSDGKNLYLAIKTEIPPSGNLLSRAKPSETDTRAYLDDSIELWIDPHRDKKEGDLRYFHIIVNCLGAIYDRSYNPSNKQQPVSTFWRVKWNFKSKIENGWWNVEISIPFNSIGATEKDLFHPWGLRIGRNWKQPGIQTEWAPRTGAYEDKKTMPVVFWNRNAPVVRILSLKNPSGYVDIKVEIKNISEKSVKVKSFLLSQSSNNPERKIEKILTLKPYESKILEIKEENTQRGKVYTKILITSPDERTVYFLREFNWKIEENPKRWNIISRETKIVVFDFGYYPYKNKIKIKTDISALKNREKIDYAVVSLLKNTEKIKEWKLKNIKTVSEKILSVPPLKEGKYTLTLQFFDKNGKPLTEKIKKEFVRYVFEWENNNIGITDEVIPPFTPVKVRGKTVETVLRKHIMNNQGLWNQVISENIPVLSSPMRFEVKVNGKEEPIKEKRLKFTERKKSKAKFKTYWETKSVEAKITGFYEIDGMMKIYLNLKPKKDTKIDAINLIIPIRKDIAKLMHICTDGLRFNYSGKIPDGKGVVWESKNASRNSLKGTFIPYIWIGNEKQGICWFAKNDKDWIFDDKTSTHIVERKKGCVVLKVRFITKPDRLERERKIIFALQTTPTKPMPEKPLNWRKWVFVSSIPETFNPTILGSCYYWGGLTPCGDFYPRNKDFSIYEWMRETREKGKVSEEKFKKWIEGYDKNSPRYKTYLRHMYATANVLKRKPDKVIVYTNARGSAINEEFLTFQDEWLLDSFSSRKWKKGGVVSYGVSPVKSFQDFALYYFKKMLESKAIDGIYFDNTFLKSNFDILSGIPYIDDNGNLRPGIDIFEMREYLKRVAVLVHQMGQPWINVSHMTNTQIVPINTWVGVNLDWEWKYGLDDFQDRFTRDFIRTESIGLKTGCVPLVLIGIRGEEKEKIPWVERTLLGTTLLHEIKVWQYFKLRDEIYKKFFDFGYGEKNCKVYHYWDSYIPVKIEGVDAEPLVLSKDKKLLILLVSFDKTGNCKLKIDGKFLNLPENGKFYDIETGKIIKKISSYECEFKLKKHDFKIIEFK